MAAEGGTAIFRAVAEFGQLMREARKAKRDLKELGDQTSRTDRQMEDADSSAKKLGGSYEKVAGAAQKLARSLREAKNNNLGKGWAKVSAAGERLSGVLHDVAKRLVVFSLIAAGGAAAVGPVLSLVAAVWQLSGAVGAVPGLVLAGAAAAGVLKVAFLGVSDVLKAIGEKDAAKFDESIKDMPPAMQNVARAARDLHPQLETIRTTIQSRFWRGLEGPLNDLARKYLPMVRAQAGILASTFNLMIKDFGAWAGQKSTVDDVASSLSNVNGMWSAMRSAVKPVSQAVLDVLTVSSEFLPMIGREVSGLATKFAAFISHARESGKLKQWIQGGLDALASLGRSAMNVGRIFASVWKAAGASGINLFEILERLTGKAAAFLASTRGQEALRILFDTAAAAGRALWPVVEALGAALLKVLPVFVKVAEQIAPGLAKLIEGLGNAIAASEPELIAFGAAVGDLLMAFGESGPLLETLIQVIAFAAGPIGILAAAVRWLSSVLDSLPAPVRGVVVAMLGFGVVLVASIGFLGKAAWGVFWLVKALGLLGPMMPLVKGLFTALLVGLRATAAAALAHPVIAIITAIALIALLIITNWDTVKVWLAAFWAWLTSTATAAWNAVWKAVSDALSFIVGGVVAAWNAVWKAISDALSWILGGVVSAWNAVWKAISDAMSWIVGGLTAGWNAAWRAVSDALTFIRDGVAGAVSWVGDKIMWLVNLLGGAFSAAWSGAGDVVRSVVGAIGDAIEWVVDRIRDAIQAIKDAAGAVGDAASWVGRNVNPLNWFAKGGLVGGRGGHRPVMAEPGEYIEPVETTRKYLPLLRAINPYDSGSLTPEALVNNVAGGTSVAHRLAESTATAGARGTAEGAAPTVGAVTVNMVVHNPLPEKPSETASKRVGRAARLGLGAVLGGAA